METNMRSAKDLWSVVSGTVVLGSKEFIESELEKNSDRIVNGILFYKTANNTSIDSLKSGIVGSQFEFISKLSKLLNVDASQCYDLFCTYIHYEFRGTEKSFNSLLLNERQVQSLLLENDVISNVSSSPMMYLTQSVSISLKLMENKTVEEIILHSCMMWNYYLSERLYCFLILKYIVSHFQDASHPYKDLYERFLDKVNKDNIIVKKVILQLETLLNVEVPNKDSNGPYVNEILVHNWVNAILREQSELLQILLLYYKDMEPAIEDVEKMMQVFQKHGFGLRQPFRHYINEDNSAFIDLIGFLEGLVIIESLGLDWLYRCQESGMVDEHFLFKGSKDADIFEKLDNTVHTLGSHSYHAPILLAWMLVGRCSKISSIEESSQKLGNLALHLGVFDYLYNSLQTPSFSGKGVVSMVTHSVIYGLLSVILTEFEIHTLGSLQVLMKLCESVLKFPTIAEDFWSKGLEKGLGVFLKYAIDVFPLEFCTLINLSAALSLAGKNSTSEVIKCIHTLPVFTEYLENNNVEDVVATDDSSIWRLVRSKTLYNDSNLKIPQGTQGILVPEAAETDQRGRSIIQWQVDVNGWQICLHEVHLMLGEMSSSIGCVTEDLTERMVAIGKLVLNLLQTDSTAKGQLVHIITLLLQVLERCAPYPSAPLELLAICLDISATLCLQRELGVWKHLTKINLLPFMTGVPNKISEFSRGMHINVSVIGHLIASKECVIGRYSLCRSFLNLLVSVSKHLPQENGQYFLGCTVYVLQEILPCFHKWFYADPQEKLQIGHACLSLLHSLFLMVNGVPEVQRKAQELCIFSLLQFEAGQTLLKIICTGEEVVQQALLKHDSSVGDQITSLIRLSLSVLNRLLQLRHSLELQNEASPLEAVLFSTPGHSAQPQVVLTVAQYVFQRHNPSLSVLSVQLLKRFAKEFPMSLYACFGSEAEAFRDNLLYRLNSPYEDTRLKGAILEFLTVCVVQQPGLIEMFINVRNKGKNQEKVVQETDSCLGSVKKLIKETNESKEDYPERLYCAAVEFLHALWAGHQVLAMEALKQDNSHWAVFCKVLLSRDIERVGHRVFACIIRTLALEVFYCSASSRDKLDLGEDIGRVFKEINQNGLLLKWSEYVNNITLEEKSIEGSHDVVSDASTIIDNTKEVLILLKAWRDFLVILGRYEPMKISSSSKTAVMKHILENMSNELIEGIPNVLILLSELYLMLSKLWKSEFIASWEDSSDTLFSLLSTAASNANSCHPKVILSVVSILTFAVETVQHQKEAKSLNVAEWISGACQLLKFVSVSIDQTLRDARNSGDLKLQVTLVYFLNELIQMDGEWLSVLKRHAALPTLVALLLKSLQVQIGIGIAYAVLTLFMTLAADSKAAEMLHATGFMSEITLMLSSVYSLSKKWPDETGIMVHGKTSATWNDIYFTYLRVVTTLLQTLHHYVLQDAINFVGVHLEIMHCSLRKVRGSPLQQELEEALLTSSLVHQLSFYQQTWRIEHPLSLKVLLKGVCDSTYAAVAFLVKPNYLQVVIENKQLPDAKKKELYFSEKEKQALKRLSSEDEAFHNDQVVPVQSRLLKLLAVNLCTIKQYSPGIYETLSDQGADSHWQPQLYMNFSSPSVDHEGPLSFGTILTCINTCLRLLAKNEKTPSPVKVPHTESTCQVERHLLLYVFEVSMTLLLSQATLALCHPELNPRDKQLIRRELAAELSSVTLMMNRFLRRGPLSPASSIVLLASPGQTRALPASSDWPFIKLITSLVDKLFK